MPEGSTAGSKLMSRHGPSGSAWTCCAVSVPTSTVRRSAGQALLGSAVGSPAFATVTTIVHRCGALATRWAMSCSRKLGPRLARLIGRDRDRLCRWQQRPAHHVLCAGTVDEDEAVEAVVA